MPLRTDRIVVVLVALFFAAALPEANAEFLYTTNSGKITITGYAGVPAGNLVIPNTINGLPVTEIADQAFSNQFSDNDLLTGISIPSTVTRIGNGAFFSCHGITQINLPISLTQIGSSSFSFTGLSTIIIPQSTSTIGSFAFSDCRNLTSINVHSANPSFSGLFGVLYNKTRTTLILHPPAKAGAFSIPSTVTSIGSGAFASSTALTDVTIPASVTSIGSTAFASCSRLSSVSIPAGVASIGSGAFRDCHGLASIHVDPANPSYSSVDGVLFNLDQTTLIQCPAGRSGGFDIPSGCTVISDSAFAGCVGLGQVTIPMGLGTIGARAFENCIGLIAAGLPASVTTIGQSAFSGCVSLQEAVIPPGVTAIGNSAFSGCVSITSATLPDGLASIGDSAFSGCISITSATLPNGLSSIGSSMFSGCKSLQSISVPDSVTTIQSYAFTGCTSLTSVQLPVGLTTIGTNAFASCNSLQSITLPQLVSSIGVSAFGYCTQLTGIDVHPSNPTYSTLDGVLFNKAQTTLIQFPSGRPGTYGVPAGVTSIGDSAFGGCHSLANVTMGGDVLSIGSNAFLNCTALDEFTLGTGVTGIGLSAFSDCMNLEQINIGPNVTTIGNYAFSDCGNLVAIQVDAANLSFSSLNGILYNKAQTNLILCPGGLSGAVTIPSGVSTINTKAFSDCQEITAIHVDPASSAFSSIDGILFNKIQTTIIRCPLGKSGVVQIPASVTGMAGTPFYDCGDISAFEVDINSTAYRSLDGALYNKAGTKLLQYPPAKPGVITISAVVTGIAEGALGGCLFLTAINVDPANPVYASVDGVLFNKGLSHLIQYPGGKTGYAFIPASVSSLGSSSAFDARDDLAGVVFLGNKPSSTYFSFHKSVPIQHFSGAIGFLSWSGLSLPVINMGAQSPIKLWLLENAFPFNTTMISDMNGDGVSLLMAYALNLPPRDNLASSMPQSGLGGGFLSITYYSAKAGIVYAVETSEDLKIWTTQGVSISPQSTNGFRTASVPATDGARYIRLAVSE